MSNETAKCNDQPASERSCPDPAGSEFSAMIGKTISDVKRMKLRNYDNQGFLKVDFTDGTHCVIEGGYGSYTGRSEDEYITVIEIADADREAELVNLQKR